LARDIIIGALAVTFVLLVVSVVAVYDKPVADAAARQTMFENAVQKACTVETERNRAIAVWALYETWPDLMTEDIERRVMGGGLAPPEVEERMEESRAYWRSHQ